MANKITIEIGEEKLSKLKIIDENGEIQIKYVSIDDITKMITSASLMEKKEEENYIETPLLPQFQDISTIQYLESENTQVYIIKKDAGNIDMSYFQDKFNNVGFPTLLFKIKISHNSIRSVNLVAVKDTLITKNTELFRYPFSNVFSDTRVCLGANNIAQLDVENTSTIFRIPNLVLTLDNNNDAYRGTNNTGLALRELLEKLQNEKFNNDWLVPTNLTYDSWHNN